MGYNGSVDAIRHVIQLRSRIGAWVILVFVGFGVAFFLVMPCVCLAIALSWLLEITIATVWPPYIAHYGWPSQQLVQDSLTKAAAKNALVAAYQVLFVSDVLTNAVICGDVPAVLGIGHEISQIGTGQRMTLSAGFERFATLQGFGLARVIRGT